MTTVGERADVNAVGMGIDRHSSCLVNTWRYKINHNVIEALKRFVIESFFSPKALPQALRVDLQTSRTFNSATFTKNGYWRQALRQQWRSPTSLHRRADEAGTQTAAEG